MRHTRSGQEDAKPNIQDYAFCVIILFFTVLPFVLSDICRTEDHKPRGRASDVSTISTCFSFFAMIYCPLPHQSLWERLWVSLSCTCVAFSSFAKLYRFFPKKKSKLVNIMRSQSNSVQYNHPSQYDNYILNNLWCVTHPPEKRVNRWQRISDGTIRHIMSPFEIVVITNVRWGIIPSTRRPNLHTILPTIT